MKIIILGAGQVGRTAAYHLAREEANDVTVVDVNDHLLRDLQDRLDIRTVAGSGAHPNILELAGAASADMIVALTNSDEVNMVACQVAWTLFRTRTKIARIRSLAYTGHEALFFDTDTPPPEGAGFPVDVYISPEELVTQYVERLIRYSGALQVLDFAEGRVRLVGLKAVRGGPLVGQQLRNLREHLPNVDARVVAIYRAGHSIAPEGDTVIEHEDEVFFLAATEDMRKVMVELRRVDDAVKRVVIAGGGNIGLRLAQRIEERYQVKVIERDAARARRIAEILRSAVVLHGDAADEELLIEENIDSADVFCAVTNAEEANILSAMLAKRLGAHRVMALINRPAYAEMMQSGSIDVAISPQSVTIGSLLAHVRRGDVVRVHSLRRGAAEAIEAIAHGSRGGKVVGRRVEEIKLPKGATIGAIVRGQDVIMGHHDTLVEADDHVIVFLSDRRHVEAVERLFQEVTRKHLNLGVIQRILGQLLMLFSVTMLVPAAVSLSYADGQGDLFIDAFLILMAAGLLAWLPSRKQRGDLRLRDGFLVVVLFWSVIGLAGAVPFFLADLPRLTATEAVFESVSGFTTTGATVLVGLDFLPPSILYYRQQIQWLGGIGIVVLAVALLPLLGIGGMQLLKAETPGPMKDAKLTPRIAGTAKALWLVYLLLTAAGVLAYWAAGMSLFDAVGHSFAAVSTGGYSTHDASIGYFASPLIETITIVLMVLGGASFALHFLAWRYRRVGDYWRDPEFRAYLAVLGATTLVTVTVLVWNDVHDHPFTSLRSALFHAVSVQTSTGYTTENFALWPGALPVLLMFTTFIGGSSGSTAGGMKVVRWLLVLRQGTREVARLIHPNAEVAVKLGDKPVGPRIVEAVWGFFAVYLVVFSLLMLALMGTGVEQVTAFSAIATCINNVGPGLGEVASNFRSVSPAGQWLCTFAMLLGRLEIFPILVLLSPGFWRG